jgi:hypothetical protein
MPEIEFDEIVVPYTIRYSKRARSMSFKISMRKGFEVIVPEGEEVDEEELFYMMVMKGGWIIKHYTKVEETMKHARKMSFVTGELIQLLNEMHYLKVIESHYRTVKLWEEGFNVCVRIPAGLSAEERRKKITLALERWYRKKAHPYLIPRTYELAEQYGFSGLQGVSISGRFTRWGSCSNKGHISLNWRMMMLSANTVDYLIVHELCHLKELNHSIYFWELVRDIYPDYELREMWLQQTIPPF